MKTTGLAVLFCVALSCGSDDAGFAGPCGLEAGSYRYVHVLESGSSGCPKRIEDIERSSGARWKEESDPPSGCTGAITTDLSTCEQFQDYECEENANGVTTAIEGMIRQTSATTATGTFEHRASNATTTCRGIYRVTVSKL